MMRRLGVALVAGATLLLAAHQVAAAGEPADLVLLHGKVITVDPSDSVFQALAIRGGRIVRVGSDTDVGALVGPRTRVIDLHGRAATPGLIDAHAHVMETGLGELFEINLSGAARLADITGAVAKQASKTPPGAWIVGSGWDEGKLAERRYPTASDLDAVAPNNPVWLMQTTGHYGVANSAALKLAGIGPDTAAPPAGTIERGPDGRPTGVLKETADEAVTRLLPARSSADRRAALVHMVEWLHAEGMTGFKDPAIGPEDWAAYRALATDGGLKVNACVLFATGRSMDAARETLAMIKSARADVAALPGATLNVCGAKIFMDGSGGAPTAWMYQDWNRNRTEVAVGNHGYPRLDPDLFRNQVDLFVAAGVGIGVHAIGDRAIDWTVDSFAAALAAHPQQDLRLSIIHANTPTDHAISVMADLQKRYGSGYPESQGGFAWWLGDIYATNLGPQRSLRLNPFRTYAKRGIIWAGGSDSPVTPIAARYGLWASVARQTLKGTFGPTPFGTDEAVDVHTALRSYTAWASRQIRADDRSGSLMVGKSADIAIWDRDPYAVPVERLKDMVCDLTLFQGQVVYERGTTPAS
jgi:predicted amidohydrolase YtcJ